MKISVKKLSNFSTYDLDGNDGWGFQVAVSLFLYSIHSVSDSSVYFVSIQ